MNTGWWAGVQRLGCSPQTSALRPFMAVHATSTNGTELDRVIEQPPRHMVRPTVHATTTGPSATTG